MLVDAETVLQYVCYDLSQGTYTNKETLIQAWASQKQPNVHGQPGHVSRIQNTLQDGWHVLVDPSELVSVLERSKQRKIAIHCSYQIQPQSGLIALAQSIGARIIISSSVQETQIFGVLAHLLFLEGPVVHFYNASKPVKVENLDLKAFAQQTTPLSLEQAVHFIQTHLNYTVKPFSFSGNQKHIALSLGSSDELKEQVSKHGLGLLTVSIFHPFSVEQFLQVLPACESIILLSVHYVARQFDGLYLSLVNALSHGSVKPSITYLDPGSELGHHLIAKLTINDKKTVNPLSEEENLQSFVESVFGREIDVYKASQFEGADAAFGACLADIRQYEVFHEKLAKTIAQEPHLKEQLEKNPSLVQHDWIKHNQKLLNKPCRWIIDQDSLLELGNLTLHDLLTSKQNINVLIIDTNPYQDPTGYEKRRDVGLYCINYGTAYVASISPSYSFAQATEAIREASEFVGPSVVICHMPHLSKAISAQALAVVKQAKYAVDEAYFTLYRWNPTSGTKFQLDSTKIKADLEKFLARDAALSLLVDAEPQLEAPQTLEHDINKRVENKAKEAFAKLYGSIERKKLLILFGSDGGNAESLAKRIGLSAKEKGLFVKTMAMDSYITEDLVKEEHVLFVVSTAGQGEFPGNSRETYKYLSSNQIDLSPVKVAVFGLGDSHYWPRPEDAHYYCKSSKDLDALLNKLGAQKLVPLGLGNDRDPDGYHTGFNQWVPDFWNSLGVDAEATNEASAPSDDAIKAASNFLRGTIAQGLVDESTGALAEYDTKLTKFHGIYQQDDRDIREHRALKGLEKAYSFMIRVRVPGGVATPEQWLAMDTIANTLTSGTIKITTRQAFQFHGVVKKVLKKTIQEINRSLMDTIAACGDVNRNVMCNPNPGTSKVHAQVLEFSRKLSTHLTPATGAYHEIWLDKKLVASFGNEEPLYGKTYLPRKFKVAVAVPPHNDVDVFAHDLGYIAVVENGSLVGFNVTVGGGMGQTHGNKKTYPVLAKQLGYITIDRAVDVGEKVMLVQRDYGDRTNRKHARLKYTIEDRGLDWFRDEVEKRLGYKLEQPKPFKFISNGDRYGWHKGDDGKHTFTLFIQSGRVKDTPEYPLMTGLRQIALVHKGDFRLTPNQHLVIGGITEEEKPRIEGLLNKYGINNNGLSGLRLNSMACVALPTCALAMAESERYLPLLMTKIEDLLDREGLRHEEISIRMTGCPNGCARPSIAEIAFIGKAPGMYNFYLGGGFTGERLNKLYKESIGEEEILADLSVFLKKYSHERQPGEHFGDFVIRAGIV